MLSVVRGGVVRTYRMEKGILCFMKNFGLKSKTRLLGALLHFPQTKIYHYFEAFYILFQEPQLAVSKA